MTRPPDDNTPPAAPHAPGTDTDPHRDGGSEARPDPLRDLPRSYEDAVAEVGRWRSAYDAVLDELQAMLRESGLTVRQGLDTVRRLVADGHGRREVHRRLLDILGWESGTEEQALEALADAVRVARGGRMGKDVHLQRNEARAECERLRRENARLQRKANELPGLTATLDEYAHFARLVGECLTQHDESNGCVTGVKQPDGPITARVRAALAGLSPIPERPGDKHPAAPVEGPEGAAR